jgi:hypothetical protein
MHTLIEQALWLLGHPSGPGSVADLWQLPRGATSVDVIVDREPPMKPQLNLGPYFLEGTDDDVQLPNPNWAKDVDALIKYMMGPTEWANSNGTVASGQTRGLALQQRFWCCLKACEMYGAEFEQAGTILLDDASAREPFRATVAYVLVALNLVKLRASLLHTSGSYV